MKLKFKKYIHLLNDVTNLLLKKDKFDLEEKNKKLRIAMIIVSIITLILLILLYVK